MKLVSLLLILLSFSCSTIQTDYQQGADFSAFKSFAFHPKDTTSGLNTQRAHNALIVGLKAKGLTYLEESSPASPADLLVRHHYSTTVTSRYVYSGGGRYYHRNYHFDTGYTVQDTYRYLIVEFINTKTNQVVWQGSSSGFEQLTSSEKQFTEAINGMLEFYPPKPEQD